MTVFQVCKHIIQYITGAYKQHLGGRAQHMSGESEDIFKALASEESEGNLLG